MAGTLFHAVDFEKNEYVSSDGRSHYEVIPVDGDMEVMSVSNWVEIVTFCERLGIKRSDWPEFDDEFDIPFDEVRVKNAHIAELFNRLTPEDVEGMYWLERIVGYVRNREMFFFAMS